MGLFNSGKPGRPRKINFMGVEEPKGPMNLTRKAAEGPPRKRSKKRDTRTHDLFGNRIKTEEDQEFSLAWTTKKRDHKDKWKLEEEFRNKFLNGEFKVRKGVALRNNGSVIKINYNGDLDYGF